MVLRLNCRLRISLVGKGEHVHGLICSQNSLTLCQRLQCLTTGKFDSQNITGLWFRGSPVLWVYRCISASYDSLQCWTPCSSCQILLACVGLQIYHHLASCLLERAQSILSIGSVGNRKTNLTKLFHSNPKLYYCSCYRKEKELVQ